MQINDSTRQMPLPKDKAHNLLARIEELIRRSAAIDACVDKETEKNSLHVKNGEIITFFRVVVIANPFPSSFFIVCLCVCYSFISIVLLYVFLSC